MNKILAVAVAMSFVASAGFAGGVEEAALKFAKAGPTVTLANRLPPIMVVTLGGAAAVIVGVLGNSGASTTTGSVTN